MFYDCNLQFNDCCLYCKHLTIVIYDCNDRGVNYNCLTIAIFSCNRPLLKMTCNCKLQLNNKMFPLYKFNDSGLHYRNVSIVMYKCNVSGLYYKCVAIVINNCNDSVLILSLT
jgi:hypothetical protein